VKHIAIALIVVLLLALCACGKAEPPINSTEQEETTVETTASVAVITTALETKTAAERTIPVEYTTVPLTQNEIDAEQAYIEKLVASLDANEHNEFSIQWSRGGDIIRCYYVTKSPEAIEAWFTLLKRMQLKVEPCEGYDKKTYDPMSYLYGGETDYWLDWPAGGGRISSKPVVPRPEWERGNPIFHADALWAPPRLQCRILNYEELLPSILEMLWTENEIDLLARLAWQYPPAAATRREF